MKKVYLAGQWNEHDNNWKKSFMELAEFEFHDPEIHSNQESPDTFFPDDLNGVTSADIMVANPSTKPSEATWIEIGFFYATHTKNIGEKCDDLIIVWREDRLPIWSIEFVKKAGHIVKTTDDAKELLKLNYTRKKN